MVPIEPFAEIVRDFVRRWNKDRPQPGGQYGDAGPPPIRPIAWIAAEASLSESTVKNVFERRFLRIELRIADALAMALDAPYIFSDPRVEGHITPNPFASREARVACCSGSTMMAA